jgi:hypothetical protein
LRFHRPRSRRSHSNHFDLPFDCLNFQAPALEDSSFLDLWSTPTEKEKKMSSTEKAINIPNSTAKESNPEQQDELLASTPVTMRVLKVLMFSTY